MTLTDFTLHFCCRLPEKFTRLALVSRKTLQFLMIFPFLVHNGKVHSPGERAAGTAPKGADNEEIFTTDEHGISRKPPPAALSWRSILHSSFFILHSSFLILHVYPHLGPVRQRRAVAALTQVKRFDKGQKYARSRPFFTSEYCGKHSFGVSLQRLKT